VRPNRPVTDTCDFADLQRCQNGSERLRPLITASYLHAQFFLLFTAELGTSDTSIDISIFDTYWYRIQKKVSKYRTTKVSEYCVPGYRITKFHCRYSDTVSNTGKGKSI
jgi:hypothetical protein